MVRCYALKPNPSNFANSMKHIWDCSPPQFSCSHQEELTNLFFCLYQVCFSLFIFFHWNFSSFQNPQTWNFLNILLLLPLLFSLSLSLSLNILLCNLEPLTPPPFPLLYKPTPSSLLFYFGVGVYCNLSWNPQTPNPYSFFSF